MRKKINTYKQHTQKVCTPSAEHSHGQREIRNRFIASLEYFRDSTTNKTKNKKRREEEDEREREESNKTLGLFF